MDLKTAFKIGFIIGMVVLTEELLGTTGLIYLFAGAVSTFTFLVLMDKWKEYRLFASIDKNTKPWTQEQIDERNQWMKDHPLLDTEGFEDTDPRAFPPTRFGGMPIPGYEPSSDEERDAAGC